MIKMTLNGRVEKIGEPEVPLPFNLALLINK
jgi:hypothetical protein